MSERAPEEGYGNPNQLGYPYHHWRHFPFNPNHQQYDMQNRQYNITPAEVNSRHSWLHFMAVAFPYHSLTTDSFSMCSDPGGRTFHGRPK